MYINCKSLDGFTPLKHLFLFLSFCFLSLSSVVVADTVSACGTLGTANTIYQLTQNVSVGGTCFNIGANNVTLDCQGYTITATSQAYAYGAVAVLGNYYNYTTVKNCNIITPGGGGGSGGIWYVGSNSTIIYNNLTLTDTDNYAVSLYSASPVGGTNVSYNRMVVASSSTHTERGITVDSSASNNTFSFNTIILNGTPAYGDAGIRIGSNNNLVSDNNISAVDSFSKGIILSSSVSGNAIRNTRIASTISSYIDVLSGTSNNNMTNTTFYSTATNNSVRYPQTISLPANSNVTPVTLNLSAFNRVYLNSAALSFLNTSAELTIKGLNFTNARPTVAYDDATFAACSSPQCNSSYNATAGTLAFNVSRFTTYSSEEVITSQNISACGSLSTSDRIYNLTQNVSSAGTCFTIAANNVTLDCQGYAVNFSQSSPGHGVVANGYSNMTVKNCNIVGFNDSSSFGIYFVNANGANISNNTLSTKSFSIFSGPSVSNSFYRNNVVNTSTDGAGVVLGIYFQQSSNNNVVSNNSITVNGINGRGFQLDNTITGTNVSNNLIVTSGSGSSAIFLNTNANNNVFANNTLVSNGSYLYADGTCTGNNITNTTFNATNSSVKYPQTLAVSAASDVTSAKLNLTAFNRIYLNTSALPFLNSSAELTIRGLSFTGVTPTVAYDDTTFAACSSPQCNITSYVNGTFTFNVSRFTTYSSQEGPVFVSACGTLNVSNKVYQLVQNVNSSGKCFTIAANNITLDCQGYAINYSSSYGIDNAGAGSFGYNLTTIKNCNIRGTGSASYAMYFYKNNNNTIANNTIATVSTGILLSISSGNNVSNNNITTTGGSTYAIFLSSSSQYNTFANNTLVTYGGSSQALRVYTSAYNNFTGNNLSTYGSSSHGIYGYTPCGFTNWWNNTVSTNGSSSNALDFWACEYVNYSGNSFAVFGSGSTNINLASNSHYQNFTNNVLTNNPNGAAYFSVPSPSATGFNMTNTTFNATNNSVRYFQTLCFPQSVNTVVTTANLNLSAYNRIYMNSSNLSFLNVSAVLSLKNLSYDSPHPTVAFDDATFSDCSSPQCNYSSYASRTLTFNVSGFTTYSSNETLNLTSACGTLSAPALYRLTQNVTSGGNCFTVQANAVVVDCQGYTINSTGTGVLFNGYNYTTVKNCRIISGSRGIGGEYGSNYALITNNTVVYSADHPIILGRPASYNNVTNNTLNSSAGIGVYLLQSANNNLIANNTITISNNLGVYLYSSASNNTISGNTIVTNADGSSGYGIYVVSGTNVNNFIIGNNITTTGGTAYGILLSPGSTNNTLSSNWVRTTGATSGGIVILSTSNNTVFNSTINATGGGFYLGSGDNNTLIGNNITSSGNSGIYIDLSSGNNVSNNVVSLDKSSAYGVIFDRASLNNILSNNSIATYGNGSYALYLLNGPDNNSIMNDILINTHPSGSYLKASAAGSSNSMTNTTFASRSTTANAIWHFNEGSGTTAGDSSGNNNTGNTGTATWISGKLGNALDFGGSGTAMAVNHSASLVSTPITIEFWAKSNTANWNDFGFLVSKRNSYIVHPMSGSRELAVYLSLNGSGLIPRIDYVPSDITSWHHYAFTYNGSMIKF